MSKMDIVGNAQFDVEPDTANLAISIEQRDYDYASCAAALTRRTQAARLIVEGCGVEPDAIRSHDYRVEKMSDYARKLYPAARFTGTHVLRIKMPLDREKINRLLAMLTASDAELEVSLGYEVRDLTAHRDKAEALAVADALRRSAIIANAAGCRVVGILAIRTGQLMHEEHTEDGWDINLSAAACCSEPSSPDSPEVTPRMLSVSASISIQLEIVGVSS
jgi:uncharacterized protein YggE